MRINKMPDDLGGLGIFDVMARALTPLPQDHNKPSRGVRLFVEGAHRRVEGHQRCVGKRLA